jgi:exodeoxyribonuclease VII small subunit
MSPKKTATAPESGENFEKSLQRLEAIVEKLEEGSVTLDEVLKLYEEGILLSRKCMDRLDEAELKVKRLMKDVGGKLSLADEPEE